MPLLRRSREAREAIEDTAPVIGGFDVAFVIHDLAGPDTEEHAEDCVGCVMLSELAADRFPALLDPVAQCPGCPCSLSACVSNPCGHACCCP